MSCRSCGAASPEVILALGEMPLANALLRAGDLGNPEPRWPLTLAFCTSCSLVQILETVPPEQLFGNYVYFSSFSDTMLRHARELARRLVNERRLGSKSLVLEVASNDGYLLQHYKELGVPVLGVEPARNVAAVAEERGIPTVPKFFGAAMAGELPQADVLHANNVLAHVADLNGFVEGIRTVLKPGGAAIIEVPYLGEMIPRLEFDTIYHEHLCYFSLTALERLFRRHGLAIADVEQIPLHGGSLLLTVTHEHGPASGRVARMLHAEGPLASSGYYADFAARVAAWRTRFRAFLADLRGRRLAAYGAAAKGATLLNHAGVGRETLQFVADRSTHKQGLHMPGVHLPIRPPEALLEEQPDAVVLLAWNFKEEILAQQAEYLRRGGRFIVPVPEPTFA